MPGNQITQQYLRMIESDEYTILATKATSLSISRTNVARLTRIAIFYINSVTTSSSRFWYKKEKKRPILVVLFLKTVLRVNGGNWTALSLDNHRCNQIPD